MCDYSLEHVESRPAKVGDKLTTRDFGTGTRGFSASEDRYVARCICNKHLQRGVVSNKQVLAYRPTDVAKAHLI
jgi:hypothetical protein